MLPRLPPPPCSGRQSSRIKRPQATKSSPGAGLSAADGIVYSIEGDRKNAALSFGGSWSWFTGAGVAKAATPGLGVVSNALKVVDHAAPTAIWAKNKGLQSYRLE
jgi:hypothetical protein